MQQIKKTTKSESGFALLITLITVTALVSIGLSVIDLTVRQVRLASVSTDSEIAFHAANAGAECAQYWRREETMSETAETGGTITVDCFDQSPVNRASNRNVSNEVVTPAVSGAGNAYFYQYQFSWGSPTRCSRVSQIVINATVGGGGATVTNIGTIMPGYPGTQKTCTDGGRCSVVSSEGFNKACNQINSYGTVQREVLLQL